MVVEDERDLNVTITMVGEDEEGKKVAVSAGRWLDTRTWAGWGTPPSREEMVRWLQEMSEEELAQKQMQTQIGVLGHQGRHLSTSSVNLPKEVLINCRMWNLL